jgi:MscS family membrane protein
VGEQLMFLEQLSIDIRDLGARALMIVAVLAALWLLRFVVAWLLSRPLVHLAERSGNPQLDDKLRNIVNAPIQLAFFSMSVIAISAILTLDENGVRIASQLARSLMIAAIGLLIYNIIGVIGFSRNRLYALTGINIEESLLPFIRTGLQFLIVAMLVVIIVQEWGYDVSALVAGLGIGGLAVSLAAQDTIANLFGFSMIVGDRPFVVGDYIKTNDVEGTVERVGLRSTRVRQPDQALVTVPNRTLANSVIMNWSRLGKRYINFIVRTAPDVPPQALQQTLARIREMLEIRPRIETDSILVHFSGFSTADDKLEISVRAYVQLTEWSAYVQEREIINLEIIRIMGETLKRNAALAEVIVQDEKAKPPVDASPTSTQK